MFTSPTLLHSLPLSFSPRLLLFLSLFLHPSLLLFLPPTLASSFLSFLALLPATNYTPNCDVYSFGVVLWEMITRRKPFIVGLRDRGIPVHSIMFKIAEGTVYIHVCNTSLQTAYDVYTVVWEISIYNNYRMLKFCEEIFSYNSICMKIKNFRAFIEPSALEDRLWERGPFGSGRPYLDLK